MHFYWTTVVRSSGRTNVLPLPTKKEKKKCLILYRPRSEPSPSQCDGRVSDSPYQRRRRRHPRPRNSRSARVPEQVDQFLTRLAKAVFRVEKRHIVVFQISYGNRVRLPRCDKPAESDCQGGVAQRRLRIFVLTVVWIDFLIGAWSGRLPFWCVAERLRLVSASQLADYEKPLDRCHRLV